MRTLAAVFALMLAGCGTPSEPGFCWDYYFSVPPDRFYPIDSLPPIDSLLADDREPIQPDSVVACVPGDDEGE